MNFLIHTIKWKVIVKFEAFPNRICAFKKESSWIRSWISISFQTRALYLEFQIERALGSACSVSAHCKLGTKTYCCTPKKSCTNQRLNKNLHMIYQRNWHFASISWASESATIRGKNALIEHYQYMVLSNMLELHRGEFLAW